MTVVGHFVSRRDRRDVDQLARHLGHLGRMARSMPPSWDAHADQHPILGLDGERLGHVLPGKGLALNVNPKDIGLTRRIPHVIHRDVFQRLREWWNDDRAAITTWDGVVAARATDTNPDIPVQKNSFTTVANCWASTFRAGGSPVAGSYSSTPGSAPDGTNVGALSLGMALPGGSNVKYLISCLYWCAQQLNMVCIADLLVAVGSISASSNAAQTVSSTALTRYTSGAGVWGTLEVTTQLGGTAANHTCSYTNQAGTSGQTSQSFAMTTSAIVQRLQPQPTAGQLFNIPLASGDTGMQAVSTSTLSASMTAGVYALNLFKPLIWIPGVAANVPAMRDAPTNIEGIVQLVQTATPQLGCLTAYVMPNTTTSGIWSAIMQTCAG